MTASTRSPVPFSTVTRPESGAVTQISRPWTYSGPLWA
jgi:hypothetical protein